MQVSDKQTHQSFSTIYFIEKPSDERNSFLAALEPTITGVLNVFDTAEDMLSMPRPDLIIADNETIGDPDIVDCLKSAFHVPIIVLSDRPTLAGAVRLMRAGASDLFPKPVSINALNERLRTLLMSASTPSYSNFCEKTHQTSNAIVPFAEQERQIIETALGAFHGNITMAAAALQISPSTIYRKRQSWTLAQ